MKNRQEKQGWFQEERELQRQAGTNLTQLEDSMWKYYISKLNKAPKLSDFYDPSEEQKNGVLTLIVGSLALLEYTVHKYSWAERVLKHIFLPCQKDG